MYIIIFKDEKSLEEKIGEKTDLFVYFKSSLKLKIEPSSMNVSVLIKTSGKKKKMSFKLKKKSKGKVSAIAMTEFKTLL